MRPPRATLRRLCIGVLVLFWLSFMAHAQPACTVQTLGYQVGGIPMGPYSSGAEACTQWGEATAAAYPAWQWHTNYHGPGDPFPYNALLLPHGWCERFSNSNSGFGHDTRSIEQVARTVPCPAPVFKDSTRPSCEAGADPGQVGPHPILFASGTKLLVETDLRSPAVHGLDFERTYLSAWTESPAAGMGTHWSHGYAHRLLAVGPAARTVLFGDGRVSHFELVAGQWQARGGNDRLTDAGDSVVLTRAADDSTWSFDKTRGLVLSVRSRNGWETRFSYADQQLVRVTNAFGRTLDLSYDEQGRLAQVQGDGGAVGFGYDALGRLVSATRAGGASRQYLYEDPRWPQALTGILDESGARWSTYTYDDQGRAITSELAGGVDRTAAAYGPGQSTITDALGMTRSYRYERPAGAGFESRTVQASAPAADAEPLAAQSFDANGLLASQVDFLGVARSYTWDSARRLPLASTRAVGWPQAQTVQIEWHPRFALPLLVREAGRTTRLDYDERGNPVASTITDLATGQARSRSWTYDAQGLVASMREPDGGTWTYAYDTAGNLTRITDPLGRESLLAYDGAGRLVGRTDPGGLVSTRAYDALGRPIVDSVAGEATHYSYLPTGLLHAVALHGGLRVQYAYDAAHRLVGASDNRGATVSFVLDAAGNRVREEVRDAAGVIASVTARTLNALNQVASVQGALGQAVQWAYDANGRAVAMTDPLNRSTRQALDPLGRPARTTYADNGVESSSWNPLDQLTGLTDAKGVSTAYAYNAFGEVVAESSADIGSLTHEHDAAGAIVLTRDAKGQSTRIERDALGRPVAVHRADGQVVRYAYDAGGGLAGIQDASGGTLFERDPRGRVVMRTQRPVDSSLWVAGYRVRYEREGALLRSVSYPSGLVVHYRRDGTGRITGIDTQLPRTGMLARPVRAFVTGLSYTALGQPQAWRWASGDSAGRSFDADGRMVSNEFARYRYDAAGQIVGLEQSLWARPAAAPGLVAHPPAKVDLAWTLSYDARGRLAGMARAGAQGEYTYDANGNRLSAAETRQADIDLDRLHESGGHTRSQVREALIDPASNRLQGQILVTTTPPAGVGSPAGSVGTRTAFELDANGSLTSDGRLRFDYDAAGRVSRVRIPGKAEREAQQVSYRYNGLGQRVFKSEAGAVWLPTLPTWLGGLFGRAFGGAKLGTAFVYGDAELPAWALLGEYDNGSAAGKGRTEYIWLPLEDGSAIPIGMLRGTQLHAIHTDHLGTPRLMTDAFNRPVWQWPYSAFGDTPPTGVLVPTPRSVIAPAHQPRQLRATAARELNLRFPGQYFDEETGTSYNYFRDYDPAWGRYRQVDPVGLAGGSNRFSYVEANPMSFVDPMGLMGGSGSGAAQRNPPTVSVFGCLALGCASYGTQDTSTQVSAELTLGGGIEICDAAPPSAPPQTCSTSDGQAQVQPPGIPFPKKVGGAFVGPSIKSDGRFCVRLGPHVSVPYTPSFDGASNRRLQ